MSNNHKKRRIYCTYITLKDGTKIYAKYYGIRAFCFEV